MKQKNKNRIWELDFLKGIALLIMIYFHVIFDLKEYYSFNISYSSGLNFYLGRFSAILFMVLSGVSSTLSKNNLRRGVKLLLLSLFLTIVTTISGPEYSIKFGILHLLGVSIIIYEYIKGLGNTFLNVIAGLTIYIGVVIMDGMKTDLNFLFPLGLTNKSFYSADYYPLLPWFGVFLAGVIIGRILYSNRQSHIKVSLPDSFVNKVGRRTLFIYLIHQPLILGLLRVLKIIKLI